MKSRLAFLVCILIACAATVIALFWHSSESTKHDNGFVRIFPSHVIESEKRYELPPGRSSILDVNDCQIVIDHRDTAIHILMIDTTLTSASIVSLGIPVAITGQNPEIKIQNGVAFIHNFQENNLIRLTKDWNAADSVFKMPVNATGFNIPNKLSVVYQLVNTSEKENFLAMHSRYDTNLYLLPKQVDGIFCTDGFLVHSELTKQYLYIFRYRNGIIQLDENVLPITVAKTIDTVLVAKIATSEISGKIVMAKPPLIVNRGVAIDGPFLFINSALMSRNEIQKDFNRNSVVDVYDLHDKSAYMFSFYAPKMATKHFSSFRVHQSKLVLIYPNNILIQYDLSKQYFNKSRSRLQN